MLYIISQEVSKIVLFKMEFTVPIKHKYGLEGLHLIEVDFGMVVSY